MQSLVRPELRQPPQLSETGQPVAPAPEKSFLQKYWMYIMLALLLFGEFPFFKFIIFRVLTRLIVATGAPAEDERGGGNRGQSRAAR